MILADLGWDAFFADAFEPHAEAGLIPARVVARHHGPCELLTERGPLGGLPAGRLAADELPAAGDWVAVRPLPGEKKALIEAVLPRRTAFVRKEAWRRTAGQVVAANVDVVFLVSAFGAELNPRRIERYLTASWESGATPVIVLNKADLAAQPARQALAVEEIAFGVPVHAVSAATGEGVEQLEAHLGRGRTGALLGSSGVGKSTLVNRLCSREVMGTGGIRLDDERGRHTTSHRELVLLPAGRGLLLDTPGMRELQLWADEDALDTTFAEIAELAERCRFRDCAHDREPGCAVQEALAAGTLSPERWASYGKLQRELRALARRQDQRLKAEARRELRRFERSRRRAAW